MALRFARLAGAAARRPAVVATTARSMSSSLASLTGFAPLPPRTPEEVALELGCDHHEGSLEALFAKLDDNGDGMIQPKELEVGLEGAGLKIEEEALEKLVSTYGDMHGNLHIAGLLEMLSAVKEHRFHSFPSEEAGDEAEVADDEAVARHYVFSEIDHFEGAIDAAFNAVDDNGDGVIQPEELASAIGKLGIEITPSKVDTLFSLYDANGDGVLQLCEFADLVANLEVKDCS